MTEEKDVSANESNGQENNEHENKAEEETELESAIIRQVEYYFGIYTSFILTPSTGNYL